MNGEPAIISYGRARIDQYGEAEFFGTLRRAFLEGSADFVVLDSNPRGQGYLAACSAWAIDKGYMRVRDVADDGQSQVCSLELTEVGRKALTPPEQA